jgi:hypothetical protein
MQLTMHTRDGLYRSVFRFPDGGEVMPAGGEYPTLEIALSHSVFLQRQANIEQGWQVEVFIYHMGEIVEWLPAPSALN